MNKKIILFSTVLLVSLMAFSKLKSEGKVHVKVTSTEIDITTDEGFHLNKDAPASLMLASSHNELPPHKKTPALFTFDIPNKETSGTIKLYVCDNANTVCEPQELKVEWKTSSAAAAAPKKAEIESSRKEKSSGKDENGFTQNNLEDALAKAKSKNQLVLVDFAARWCPPCIRLEHEVFNSKEFQKVAQNLTLVRIDVDNQSNYATMDKYSIKAFPTLIVVNGDGEEIQRYLDFQEKTAFVVSLASLRKNRPLELSQLIKKAEKGDKKAALDVADHYYKSLQYAEALQWYQKSLGVNYFAAKIGLYEENPKDPKSIEALKEAIANEPQSFDSVDWRISLANAVGTETAEGKKVLNEGLAVADLWIDNPELIKRAHQNGYLSEIKDLEVPEMLAKKGDIYELLGGNTNKTKECYEQAVQKTLELKPSEKNPTLVIYLVAYMKKVKPVAEIEPWLEKLEAAYPNELTYHQRHAKLLYENKMYDKALPYAKKAFDMSYGYNKLTSGLLVVQIENEMKNKKEAQSLMKDLLASPEAKDFQNNHTKHIVDSLEAYSKKI